MEQQAVLSLLLPVDEEVGELGALKLDRFAADDSRVAEEMQSVEEMFRPQLNEAQSTMMKTWLGGVLPFPDQTPVNHGVSGAINMRNIEGKRRKGPLTWARMSTPQWWIGREAGIAAVLFVNMRPPNGEPVKRMYDDLERALYGDSPKTNKVLTVMTGDVGATIEETGLS
ncbi:hypothetical protein BGZ61DRAFT_534514 [Ilyonectria robusta]|uniref:uncharacterized protein n=1 Tax=Ilyonectria robusta TaxID=1079257 RepID=UPI001E8E6935|nr:uncharacterized protein BGZ61DRAFT_534514 [Ilyonectria robusta]KAH8683815.1 hypothetical protein BGZ61DRAFT_534514 [Ilyonectria robusta]